MARIDWVLATDLAFFDRHARMCMVGVATHLMVPTLPVAIHQMMLVARVIDPLPGRPVEVGVNVLTPTGTWSLPEHPDSVHVEVAAEYILVTLRDLPLTEEGTYRFAVHLDEQPPVAVDVAVFVMQSQRHAEVH